MTNLPQGEFLGAGSILHRNFVGGVIEFSANSNV